METILKALLGQAVGAILGRWLWIGLGVYVLGLFFWMLLENPNAFQWGPLDGKHPPHYFMTVLFLVGGGVSLLVGLWSGQKSLFRLAACLLLGVGAYCGYMISRSAGVL